MMPPIGIQIMVNASRAHDVGLGYMYTTHCAYGNGQLTKKKRGSSPVESESLLDVGTYVIEFKFGCGECRS